MTTDTSDDEAVLTMDPETFAKMFRDELEKLKQKQNDEN